MFELVRPVASSQKRVSDPFSLLFALSVVIVFQISPAAHALTIDTYTDVASWQAASGPSTSFDFDSETTEIDFQSRDFGDFTISESSAELQIDLDHGRASGNIDGTNFLRFKSNSNSVDSLTALFDEAISAFGFDYVNNDTTDDFSTITVKLAGQTFAIGEPQSSGFFGLVITDGSENQFDFRKAFGGGGRLVAANYDNFRYSTAVSEPTAILLLGLGLAGVGFARNRRR